MPWRKITWKLTGPVTPLQTFQVALDNADQTIEVLHNADHARENRQIQDALAVAFRVKRDLDSENRRLREETGVLTEKTDDSIHH